VTSRVISAKEILMRLFIIAITALAGPHLAYADAPQYHN